MRTICRYLLRLLTGFVPVVIAACYGVRYDYAIVRGKTVDAQSGTGIPGLRVKCMSDGVAEDQTLSNQDGSFMLHYDPGHTCDSVVAEDVDGAANGSYTSATVPFDESADSTTIALDRR